MDKLLIRERFARAIPTYDKQATVQRHIAQQLAELVENQLPRPAHRRVWEVGCGTGFFSRPYLKLHTPEECWLNDLCPEMEQALTDILTERIHFAAGDAEQCIPEGLFSLIVSSSSLQWLEQPFHFLEECKAHLERNGYLAFALFGEKNFQELKQAATSSLDYYPSAYWQKAATEMGYRTVYAQEEVITLKFNSPTDILRHMQQTGVTGIRREQWTKRRLLNFTAEYQRRFSTPDSKVTLTYHPIYIILKKQDS